MWVTSCKWEGRVCFWVGGVARNSQYQPVPASTDQIHAARASPYQPVRDVTGHLLLSGQTPLALPLC